MNKTFIYDFGPYEVVTKTLYERPSKDSDGNKTLAKLHVVTRDMKTNEINNRVYEDPKMIVHIIKDEHKPEHPLDFIEIEKTRELIVSYANVTKEVAEELGDDYIQYWWDCIKQGNYKETGNIHKSALVHRSDMHIEDYVRYENYFQLAHDCDFNAKLGFMDIEVDVKDLDGFPEPEKAERPVNALTYIDGDSNKLVTLLLRNPDYAGMAEFESDIPGFIKEFKQIMLNRLGEKTIKKYDLDLDVTVLMFDEEIKLIASYYKILHEAKPEFVMAWNARFDNPYLIHRIDKLGYHPASVVCNKEFGSDYLFYYTDDFHYAHDKKSDVFKDANYHNNICQLITYAASQYSAKPSYTLDFVAEDEVDFGKLDIYEYTDSMGNFPYDNYKMFVIYNMIDVVAQVAVERKTGQVGNILRRSIKNATRPTRIFRLTDKLKNRATIEFEKQGFVISNNRNKIYSSTGGNSNSSDSDLSYIGGFVADPTLNGYIGMSLFGMPSKYIHENVIDYDYSSLYPSIIETFNNSANCQYGRVIVDDFCPEIVHEDSTYTPGGKFIDDYETKDVIHIGHRWFNTPTALEIIHKLQNI